MKEAPANTTTTKMPDGCSMCVEGANHHHHLLHLHAACHLHAPLRLEFQRIGRERILIIRCYIPDCLRHVATFPIAKVQQIASRSPSEPNDCDLCSDNDPQVFRKPSARVRHDFTAPFRMEAHTKEDGSKTLHVFCYVEGCNRLFAVLVPNEPDSKDKA